MSTLIANVINYVMAEKRSVTKIAPENIRLRLEAREGYAAKEYRIQHGNIEVRTLHIHCRHNPCEDRWQQLTPEQVSAEVERNSAIAQWAERRLGWSHLLQACMGQELCEWRDTAASAHQSGSAA